MGNSNVDEFALFLKSEQMQAVELNFSKCSTIGVGGVARAIYPRSFTELMTALDGCQRRNIPFRILGKMSNVLPPQADDGTVYILTTRLCDITMGDAPLAYAGASVNAFLQECKRQGKSGAEFLAGIPCTVGGAAYMNAGVSGHYFSDVVRSVIVYENGELKTYSKDACEYAYKHSRFMAGGVILAVVFDLKQSTPFDVESRIRAFLLRRRGLPKGKSMGCVFKNPEGCSAGLLLDGAGLKGVRIGGAVVAAEHANFIINDSGATVEDVTALIELMRRTVYEKYGVALQEEICYL